MQTANKSGIVVSPSVGAGDWVDDVRRISGLLKKPTIATLLVPQGAEFGAVCQGLRALSSSAASLPQVVPVPMGMASVSAYLAQLSLPPGGYLLMGMGGGLSPELRAGDVVIGQRCLTVTAGALVEGDQSQPSEALTSWLKARLRQTAVQGTVVTSDRILCTAADKQALHRLTQGNVVDMESSAVLAALAPQPVAILRVISDDVDQTLPDLTAALGPEGQLRPWPLARSFLQRPRAAAHLIQSSLLSLRRLQTVTTQLFSALPVEPAPLT